MKITSIGDRVSPGVYRLHSRFSRVVNFSRAESLVALVTEEVGRGPVNIVVGETAPGPADFLSVDPAAIRVGRDLCPRRGVETYDSRWEPGLVDRDRLERNLGILGDCLRSRAAPESLAFLLGPAARRIPGRSFRDRLAARFAAATEGLFRSEKCLVEGCRRLKGLGPGLTPAGDDFIAGILTALRIRERLDGRDRSILKREIATASRSGNLLSNSFISLAAGGWFFERLKNLLDGLAGDDPAELRRRAGELIAFGASSGSDLAVGLLLTLKNCRGGGNISGKNGDFTGAVG